MKDKILKIILLVSSVILIGIVINVFIFIPLDLQKLTIIVILFLLLVFLIFISDYFVIKKYPLLGMFINNVVWLIVMLSILIFIVIPLFVKISGVELKDIIMYFIILLFFVVILIEQLAKVINCIKDFYIVKKEAYLNKYSVTHHEENKHERSYYLLKGIDELGNELELKFRKKITNNENGLKINYYENLGVIKSIEYVEK